MKHPEDGEWMEFLYGELGAEASRRLAGHRAACSLCDGRISQWERARAGLDGWRLPSGRSTAARRPRSLTLAAAAAMVMAAGFGCGLSVVAWSRHHEEARIGARVAAEIDRLRLSVRAEMEARLRDAREADALAVESQLAELRHFQARQIGALRGAVERIAYSTLVTFDAAGEELVRLASATQSENSDKHPEPLTQ